MICYLFHCLRNREVISQTCQRPNIKYISSTGKSAMRYDIIMDLARGHSYDNPAISESFLAYGKNVGQAIPFLFRPVISTMTIIIDCHANHQPECRPLGMAILRHFSCALRTSSKNVLVRGLGVSLSLFSQ